MDFAANEFVRDRYSPFRAEHGRRLHFEDATYQTLHSPWDHAAIAQVGLINEAQALENLKVLRRTFLDKKQPPTFERIEILKKTARKLEERHAAFSDLIAWEGGKPIKDARIEVTRAINSLEEAASEAGRLAGEEIPMRATKSASGHVAFTYPEPIGVALAISAFNHPLNLIVHQVAPALAVGCPVMVKPALETPLSCLHFLDLLYDSGLPPEMCLPLIAENDVVERIARSRDIGFMTFIGSAKVGWYLKSILAPGTRFSLEHGGSAPAIVDASADLDIAVPTLLKGAFYHSGQVCVSTQRIFAHEEIKDQFQSRFMSEALKLKVGDPRLEETDCGPLIRKKDLDRIGEWVGTAVQGGAEIIFGGKKLGPSTYQPTLLFGAAEDDRILKEEIFGPVASLEVFRDPQSVIARANDVDWSFQAAVFSNDLNRCLEYARGLRASAVMINDGTAFRVDWMPFRGDGPSGFGTGGIRYTMRDMITEKMVVIKSPHFNL